MLVGAFVAAFKISNWISFYYNLIPIIVYMGVCLMAPSKWQLILSAILSTFYALVMMAVIVGTSLQLGEVRFLILTQGQKLGWPQMDQNSGST